MKKILISLIAIVMCIAAMGSAFAYLIDTETSAGNTFEAGDVDLTIDNANGTNVIEFNASNLNVGSQVNKVIKLTNIGSVAGSLDISNITLVSDEVTLEEPETEAGDPGTATGELQDALSLRMFWSPDNCEWYDVGDVEFFSNKFANVASSYDSDIPLAANGGTIYLVCQVNWWNNSNVVDSKAMTDRLTLGLTFQIVEGPSYLPSDTNPPPGY